MQNLVHQANQEHAVIDDMTNPIDPRTGKRHEAKFAGAEAFVNQVHRMQMVAFEERRPFDFDAHEQEARHWEDETGLAIWPMIEPQHQMAIRRNSRARHESALRNLRRHREEFAEAAAEWIAAAPEQPRRARSGRQRLAGMLRSLPARASGLTGRAYRRATAAFGTRGTRAGQ
ncbi:hypothetical protein [Streptomyces sp. WM4235]|uniref:hypothetical protein n=1 Tax=Streptomyces sp. WM4235 TaxID=1415551 RepID=UPI00131AE83E|nr:hypothetical protein [Streptomyces sp. WM4235]